MRVLSRNLLPLALSALLLLTGLGISRPASATITITPTIVTIEGRQRYADVNLINTSDKTQTYELGWRFFKMAEGTGTYEVVEQSVTDFDLTKSLIFSPKRVTLAPHATQKIRLALRLSGEPPAPGDYRAHLEFTQTRESANAIGQSSVTGEKGKMQVGIGVNVAFSIPVIYRVGETDMAITLGEITTRLNEKQHILETLVPVTRTGGAFGLAGDLTIYHTPLDGKETMVGQIQNANIFPEAKTRLFEVGLNTDKLQNGTLRVVLKDSDAKKNTIYAEKIIQINAQ